MSDVEPYAALEARLRLMGELDRAKAWAKERSTKARRVAGVGKASPEGKEIGKQSWQRVREVWAIGNTPPEEGAVIDGVKLGPRGLAVQEYDDQRPAYSKTDLVWAVENLSDEGVAPDRAPSKTAWSLLMAGRGDAKLIVTPYLKLMEESWQREKKFEDDGEPVVKLIRKVKDAIGPKVNAYDRESV